MAYNSLIPQPNDLLSQSQSEIQQNFAEIQTLIGVNHVNFGAAGAGKHNFVTMPEQGVIPTTGSNEGVLYTAQVAGQTELFFRKSNNAAPVSLTSSSEAGSGWTSLPSGVIIQWGSAVMNGGVSSLVVNLPIAFPNAIFVALATPNNVPSGNYTDNILAIQATSTTQVTALRKTNFGTACSFNFMAIGN